MLVPAMITLSAKSDRTLRAQVAETVSIIAGYDFPERWDGLVKVRSRNRDEKRWNSHVHIGARCCAQAHTAIVCNQPLGA